MKAVWSIVVLGCLVLLTWLGAEVARLGGLLAVVVPYAALATFLVGLIARVIHWARSPVPFRIPTTCGQQRSLSWTPSARLDNPATGGGAALRLALEVLTFRSLFRNTRTRLRPDGRLTYSADKWLWAGALAFHASFLVILLRHFRFFAEPVPAFVGWIQGLDGFFQVGVPEIYLTDVVFVAALGYLLGRRLLNGRIRYLSLPADYFPLLLLLGIATTGILLRHLWKADLMAVKRLALGLATLRPVVVEGLPFLVVLHLMLVSALFAYLPFSKLAHMAGVFLSPTRNLANDNRASRHVNPWNSAEVGHTYAEWQEEFHDKLVAAGLPLDGE